MSFGFSIGDVVALGTLAWKSVQNSRKACGEYSELTREVSALHHVLQRLELEVVKPESPINKHDNNNAKELHRTVKDCAKVLRVLDIILEKYNALDEKEGNT